MRRQVTCLLVSALLALTLGGCGADGASDITTGTTRAGADVRDRLAEGLATVSPHDAQLVKTSRTEVTPVEATWLRGWQVFDVLWSGPNHPVRFYAALSDDGTALMLTGSPESFSQMARSAQVVVDDATVAVEVGNLYLDVTRDFYRWSERIDSMSDIEWRPDIDSDVAMQQQRADLETQFGEIVQPPVARPSDSGWSVTIWMTYDRSLVRHDLEIATDGAVHDSAEIVAADMPLPYSQ